MASVNKWIGIGNLGKDVELRYMTNGDAIANLSIACTESWKDKSGEKQERTEWVRISMFGRLAEIAGEYLKKGSSIYIEGKLQTRKWQDKEGNDRYTTEIVANEMKMLGGRGDSDKSADKSKPAAAQPVGGGGDGFADMDDDIPFITASPYYEMTNTLHRRMLRYGSVGRI